MGTILYIFQNRRRGIMGKKEEPMIAYYEDARHFAWLVNGWIYHGNGGIEPAQIKPKNIRLTGRTGKGKNHGREHIFKEIKRTQTADCFYRQRIYHCHMNDVANISSQKHHGQ